MGLEGHLGTPLHVALRTGLLSRFLRCLLLNVKSLLDKHLFPIVNVHVMVMLQLRLRSSGILAMGLRVRL